MTGVVPRHKADDIVLWLLGGVARLRGEASSPGVELRVAGVGPLVSLVVGVVFGMSAWWVHSVSGAGLAVDALAWLAAINVVLAVFNAIPAAPLDGGRLLRAFLWRRSGDRLRATVGASTAGRGFGWFQATLETARHVRERDRSTVAVGDIMVPLARVDVVGPDEPLADLLPRLEPNPQHRVLVVAHGRLVGVVSASDVSGTVTWLTANNPQRRNR